MALRPQEQESRQKDPIAIGFIYVLKITLSFLYLLILLTEWSEWSCSCFGSNKEIRNRICKGCEGKMVESREHNCDHKQMCFGKIF